MLQSAWRLSPREVLLRVGRVKVDAAMLERMPPMRAVAFQADSLSRARLCPTLDVG